jgi:hypothetical protein
MNLSSENKIIHRMLFEGERVRERERGERKIEIERGKKEVE